MVIVGSNKVGHCGRLITTRLGLVVALRLHTQFLHSGYVSRVIYHPVQKKDLNGTPLSDKARAFYFAILA
jgi:hypothetical protein